MLCAQRAEVGLNQEIWALTFQRYLLRQGFAFLFIFNFKNDQNNTHTTEKSNSTQMS